MATIGHYGSRVLVGIMLVLAMLDLARVPVGLGVAIAGSAGMMLALASRAVHDGRLCERCIATMPLDGAERAQQRRRLLRAVHTWGTPILQVGGVPVIAPIQMYIVGAVGVLVSIWEDAQAGYSSCWTANDLASYITEHIGTDPGDGRVLVFEGQHAGTGFDGEPLAIPTRIVKEMTWTEFTATL